jgi:hypothetical protein
MRAFRSHRRLLAEAVAFGGDELDVDEVQHAVELASPRPLVSEQDAARLVAAQLEHRFALLPGLGADQVL